MKAQRHKQKSIKKGTDGDERHAVSFVAVGNSMLVTITSGGKS